MRKLLIYTVVCLLLTAGFNSAWAQTGRRNRGVRPAVGPVHLVVDAREKQLLGSFDGRTWADALKTRARVKAGESLRLYSLTGPVETVTISETKPPEYPCEDMIEIELSSLPEGEDELIGVNGSWDAQPRLPKVQSTEQQEYRNVVSSYLRRAGISRPNVKILQLLRVDLDGDGTEEVVIAANSKDDPISGQFMGRGDFSLLLLRRVVGGKAQTIPIVSEVELKNHKDPIMTGQWHHRETVAAILDINGDGVMEVITTFRSVRDGGKSVYEVKGAKPKQVLGWYCSGGH